MRKFRLEERLVPVETLPEADAAVTSTTVEAVTIASPTKNFNTVALEVSIPPL